MKKLAFLLAALLLLTACGAAAEPVDTTDPPVTETSAAPTEAPTEAAVSEIVSAELENALSFIGKGLDELKAVLGEPVEVYYEDSCSGDGDDGILNFGSVTVYTYREADGSAETVIDAEMND